MALMTKYIAAAISILLTATFLPLHAQNEKNVQSNLEEFDDLTFEQANPVRIRDSTLLRQHLIGFKWGYTLSSVSFSQDIDHESVSTPVNFGIFYTYYHSLWDKMPYFGFQTGLQYAEEGLIDRDNVKTLYRLIELPIISQFRADFWKMRLLVNIGMFGSYRLSTNLGEFPKTTHRADFGLIAGGGLGVILGKTEIQLECNYKYSFAYLYDPKIYSEEYWLFTHPNQLVISIGLFYRLGGKYGK